MVNNVGKKYLILYQNSKKFYNVYKDDAYILDYLFGYKVLDKRKSGFSDSAITKDKYVRRKENIVSNNI